MTARILVFLGLLTLTACGGGSGDLVLDGREYDDAPSLGSLRGGLKGAEATGDYAPNPLITEE